MVHLISSLIIIGCGGFALAETVVLVKKDILHSGFICSLVFYLLFMVHLIIAAISISVISKYM